MTEVLLSVIIPTRNRALFLKRLLKQFENCASGIEVIVLDDASDHAQANRNKTMVQELPRGRYTYLHDNVGAARARNLGLTQARGRFIWFIDDDDLPPVSAILDLLSLLQRLDDNVAILLPAEYRHGEQVLKTVFPTEERSNLDSIRDRGHQVNTSCVVFSRVLLDAVSGWDESLPAGQDTDLFLRVFQRAQLEFLRTSPVVVQTGHVNRITRAVWKQQVGKILMLRKHWSLFTWRRRVRYIVSFLLWAPVFTGIKLRMRQFFKRRLHSQ